MVQFSCILSLLYIFYISIYYACFIEETLSLAAAVKAGAEEVAGITRDRYIKRLTWLKSATRLSILFHKDDRKKPVFTRISNVLENLKLDSSDGRIRKQPYCVALTGAPGCGKTGTAMKIAAALIKAKYGKFRSTDVVTLNETDEYQSEYRTNHRVVIFDDVGAEDTNKSTVNPWRKIIDFVNNIRKTSLNPNLELKGNVYIQPDLVIITTNLQPNLNLSAWVQCPSAIIRRISKFYHLKRFDSVFDIPLIMTEKSGDGRVYDNPEIFQPVGLQKPEHLPLDSVLPSLVDEFLEHDDNQENYVIKMNALMDPPEKDLSAFQSFLHDQIYPRWPKKFVLPPRVEAQLPWYQRFARKFCISKQVAICQSFTPQGGEIDSHSTEEESVDLDTISAGLFSKEEILNNVMKLSHYRELRRFMKYDFHYHIVENGFAFTSYELTFFLLASGHTLKTNRRDIVIPEMAFSVAELDQWYLSTQHAKKQFIDSPVFDGPINFFRSHKYELKLDENHLHGKSMKELLRNCQRKLPEMGAEGQLCDTPSSLLTYQFLRRAWHLNYPPLAVEYNLNGLSVDGFTKIGETFVLIEAKTLTDPRDCIKRYMKDFAVDSPCIGVGINFNGYYIYYAGDVPEKDLMETAMVCSAVFRFFQKFGQYFKVNIPWPKYKNHDNEFPPPRKICS
jgi:ABC-type dipeptide/oligopeptide/nickel transport system ATPase subunit